MIIDVWAWGEIFRVPSTCKIWGKPEPLCWTLPADSCDSMGRCRTTKSMWPVRPAMSPWTTFDWSSLNARPGGDQSKDCCSVGQTYWEQQSFWLFFVWWVGMRANVCKYVLIELKMQCGMTLCQFEKISALWLKHRKCAKGHTQIRLPTCHLTQSLSSPLS